MKYSFSTFELLTTFPQLGQQLVQLQILAHQLSVVARKVLLVPEVDGGEGRGWWRGSHSLGVESVGMEVGEGLDDVLVLNTLLPARRH